MGKRSERGLVKQKRKRVISEIKPKKHFANIIGSLGVECSQNQSPSFVAREMESERQHKLKITKTKRICIE